ncbi:ATP-dependent nuclease subunit B [Lacticaseibacillus casei]|nr:ATP-dependent nuclease subunit B [Lacticaseibacillus casei]PTU97034.1 ATP-dependent nuclease subunit B [Lacticaseibacillus casei]PTU99117.1 ATP-dependent nuclease subunit B [Lacticaseibacillus casei]RXS57839.1 ATP-dependent nuclease subunit B [Lacticaseibacillus casei]TLF35107.1 ATP-dependent nuclease subunit B [Lacticaseibacillus casei]
MTAGGERQSFFLSPITRSPAQEPACKDLGRNGQDQAITPKATYTPIPKSASSRSTFHNAFASPETCT